MRKILKGDVAPFEGVILSTEEYNQLYTKQQVENVVCKVGKEIKEEIKASLLAETNFKTEQRENVSPVSGEWI